jgi:hypothetical protein
MSDRFGNRRLFSYATCAWAALFAAPHTWWALGYPAGFPGGTGNHDLMMTTAWRYGFDVGVVVLSVAAGVIALVLLRPPALVAGRPVLQSAAWIGAALLTVRGIAGLVVDGTSDLIWWPAFLTGGVLLGGVAWLAAAPRPQRQCFRV